jgi:hypothetical protein
LAHEAPIRGFPEMTGIGEGDEIAKIAKVHQRLSDEVTG